MREYFFQGVNNSVLVGQNVRKTVVCYECNKPRCIYAKKTLSIRDTRALCRLIECHDYACGSLLTPDGTCIHTILKIQNLQKLSIDDKSSLEI